MLVAFLVGFLLVLAVSLCAKLFIRNGKREAKVLGCGNHGIRPNNRPSDLLSAAQVTAKILPIAVVGGGLLVLVHAAASLDKADKRSSEAVQEYEQARIRSLHRAGWKRSPITEAEFAMIRRISAEDAKSKHSSHSQRPVGVWPEIVPPIPVYSHPHIRARDSKPNPT